MCSFELVVAHQIKPNHCRPRDGSVRERRHEGEGLIGRKCLGRMLHIIPYVIISLDIHR